MIALNNLAWLMTLRGEKAGGAALDLINHAIDQNGPNPDLLDTRGIVYLKSGDVKLALEDLKQAVGRGPDSRQVFPPCPGLSRRKQKVEAKQDLDKAIAAGLTPDSLHALEIRSYQEVLDALNVH